MLYYTIKILLSSLIIVAVSEIAKRSTMLGALLASLPLTSLLALSGYIWIPAMLLKSPVCPLKYSGWCCLHCRCSCSCLI